MTVSFWIILLAVSLYGLVHSLLASLELKAWANQRFGEYAVRGYRLFYNFFAVISLFPVLALVALLPDQTLYRIPIPWALLAIFGQALALVALAIGVLQTGAASFLGLEQLFQLKTQGKESMVTDGLYRWVRHPLYTAGLAFMWLSPVMTANLLALYLGFTVYLVVGVYFEERKLLREFGTAYAEYRRRTPMLVPGLKPGLLSKHTPVKME
jgi:protein-S-isoprenylcysteine O-methyltransferase Ste14